MQIRRSVGFAGSLVLLVVLSFLVRPSHAVSSAFTYQGQLRHAGAPVDGACDFEFRLFAAPTEGTALATDAEEVPVNAGIFTAVVDAPVMAFNGDDRWLEISVRCPPGSGSFAVLSPRQLITATPYALVAPLIARNAAGDLRAAVRVQPTGEGVIQLLGDNGSTNVLLAAMSAHPNNGFVGVYDENGAERGGLGVFASGEGFLVLRGPNGKENVTLSSLVNSPNRGFISVAGPDGVTRAGIFVNEEGQGIVFGDMKNFAVDHPWHADQKVVYTSLEGPQPAIFHRGVAHLAAGRAEIELPEHFQALADAATITVQLTPVSLHSRGVGVGAVAGGRIEIGELNGGKGTYDVHFVVHALRVGHEHHRTVLSDQEFRTEFHVSDHVQAPGVKRAAAAAPAFGVAPSEP